MKIRSLLLCTLISFAGFSQKDPGRTTSFVISGAVKSPVAITLSDLTKYPEISIGDVTITNHLGEKKSEQKALKGVLLKEVLQKVEINHENPRVLSEFYFQCIAADGYLVVYSWNELFNSPTGDSVFLITSKNGTKITDLDESVLMISSKDYKTGRRYVKALTSIEVKRAR
jgi:hypothetical protein